MSYYLVPVGNLLIDQIFKLGDIIFFSMDKVVLKENKVDVDITKKQVRDIMDICKTNEALFCNTNTALGLVDIKYDEELSIVEAEKAIHRVDKALDYIRINYCRMDNRNILMGIPGVTGKDRVVLYTRDFKQKVQMIRLKPFYYLVQPGIGLELCALPPLWKNDKNYEAIFSARTDEVYKTFRTILGRACYAFHVIDINNCFVYLFSIVEGMGSRTYCRFQERKKRIISFISENQGRFDTLNHQYYFYSKVVRSEIIHKGKNLLDMLPVKKANEIINNLYALIVEYAIEVIESGIHSFDKLDEEIERRKKLFEYVDPQEENSDVSNVEIMDDGNHIFVAEIVNLDIDAVIKVDNTIFLPRNADISLCYKCYVVLDWYEEQKKFQKTLNLDEYDAETNCGLSNSNYFISHQGSGLYGFTVSDMENIVDTMKFKKLRELNRNSPIAIIMNEPFFKDTKWEVERYSALADMICNKINHCLDYFILTSLSISTQDMRPSLVGIDENGRRFIFMVHDQENYLQEIPGKIYCLYGEPDCSMKIEKNSFYADVDVYYALHNKRTDEIALFCKRALQKLSDCYYLDDYTILIAYAFNILDMLDPDNVEGNKLKIHVLPFISNSKREYHDYCNMLRDIREKYRNPILHQGESIYSLIVNEQEIFELFSKIEHIVLGFCTRVIRSNITTFLELEMERNNIKVFLEI